jgi:hypothetical protein
MPEDTPLSAKRKIGKERARPTVYLPFLELTRGATDSTVPASASAVNFGGDTAYFGDSFLNAPGRVEIWLRASRKWCFSRTGAQRTFRYVSTGSPEKRRLQAGMSQISAHRPVGLKPSIPAPILVGQGRRI